MNAPLTYLPAYLGLYASLVLAVACNAFLDIQYGIFGVEVFLWAAAYAWTLAIGVFTSVFTAVLITQVCLAFWFRLARPKKLPIT